VSFHPIITGVGFTKTTSPRKQESSKFELAREAADAALAHSGTDRRDIDAVIIGDIGGFEAINVSAKSILFSLGLTPHTALIPISTGGTSGGHLANQAALLIRSGFATRVLIVAPNTFDGPIDLQAVINTNSPMIMEQPLGMGAVHMGAYFGDAYQQVYGIPDDDLMAVAEKNRENADHNPYAHVTSALPHDHAQRMVSTPLKLGMSCPVSSGAIAMVITDDEVARAESPNPHVEITGVGSISDGYLGGKRRDFSKFEVVDILARRIYREAGIHDPRGDFGIAELFCPYSPYEYMLPEAFGLCDWGEGVDLFKSGATRFDGDIPVNVSGGIQCTNAGVAGQLSPVAHVALQLMGQAAARQVDAERGLAHSMGGTFFQFHTATIMERVA
jgi:acetyl-CoA C-acetyltransferase